jgi:hypothetical protein
VQNRFALFGIELVEESHWRDRLSVYLGGWRLEVGG